MASSGMGVGDCASGVATLPKLETERGEASMERLRLRPMAGNAAVVGGGGAEKMRRFM